MNTYEAEIFSLVIWNCYDGVTLKHGVPQWCTPKKYRPEQITVKELKSEICG